MSQNKIKIIHMTSAHPPFDVRIYHKECVSLAKEGLDVSIIVPWDEVLDDQYVGFLNVHKEESRKKRFLKTTWSVLRTAIRNKAELYHFHDSDLIPAGFVLKALGRKVVYDVHEDLPRQILSKPWLSPFLKKPMSLVASAMEFAAGHVLDAVVAVTPYIASRFPQDKVCLLQNYPLMEELAAVPENDYSQRPMQVAYVGGITQIRGLQQIVEALELCPAQKTPLVLAGEFQSEAFSREIKKLEGWKRVAYVGWQERENLIDLLGNVRAGLVLFHPVANHVNAQPNKMFEYMSAGLPVIASDFPLWREIVEKNRCGLLVDPLNPREIAEAMTWIFDNPEEAFEMGQRGRKIVFDELNWDTEKQKLFELYRKVMK